MIVVDGIILVITCEKHLEKRLKEHINLKENCGNWKVIKVIGDLFLECDYKLEGDMMTIKCEDSYIHILKKVILSIQYLYEMFDIKEGILRCGDDLIFNENNLETFLKSSKKHEINNREYIDIDYMGKTALYASTINYNFKYEPDKSEIDNFIVGYYQCHPEDFDNPRHNLKGVDIAKYMRRPYIPNYVAGPMMYLSNKSCKILINHMSNINYDIFHYDNITDSYPYTIEDMAIGFILLSNNINIIDAKYWWWGDDNLREPQLIPMCIAVHTNKYK